LNKIIIQEKGEIVEFMDSVLNTFRVRLWMDIPKFDSWKEKARKHKKV